MKLYFFISEREAIDEAMEPGVFSVEIDPKRIGRDRMGIIETKSIETTDHGVHCRHEFVVDKRIMAGIINSYDPTTDLIAILDKIIDERRLEAEQKEAETEKLINKFLAAPDSEKLYNNTIRDLYYGWSIPREKHKDLRLMAEVSRLESLAADLAAAKAHKKREVRLNSLRGLLDREPEDLIYPKKNEWRWNYDFSEDDLVSIPELLPMIASAQKIMDDFTMRDIYMPVKKYRQLDEALKRLGTENQRERWSAGVLPVREAIELVEKEATQPFISADVTIMPADEYHMGGNCEESIKKTLSDIQWSVAKKIMDIGGKSWTYNYYIQTCQDPDECGDEETTAKMVLIRCNKKIGEISISFDVDLG
jgi:hypothetical protein